MDAEDIRLLFSNLNDGFRELKEAMNRRLENLEEAVMRRSDVKAEISSHQRICPAVHNERNYTIVAASCMGIGTIAGLIIGYLT